MTLQFADLDAKCKKSVEHFKNDLGRVRTGRASSSLLDGMMIEYYGSMVPLQQLGLVNAPEPRLITIQIYDGGAVEAIEKAIQQSELGLNPMREGNLLRLNIPSLTAERRKELVKRVHKMCEDMKVAIRNLRREAIDALKVMKDKKQIAEDEQRRGQEEIQKVTDRYIKELDTVVAVKEKEIMDV
jgi:ribosome recycling factor